MAKTDPRPTTYSRVLVAFTDAEAARALAEAACLVARAADAEIAALYVREERLAELAALPFAAALLPGRAASEPFTRETVERAWRRAEAACRDALVHAAASRARLLEAVSGRIETVIAGRAGHADLVALGGSAGFSPAPPEGLVRSVAASAGAVLIVPAVRRRAGGRERRPVLAIDDGDRAGAATVALAARIAEAGGRALAVLALSTPGRHAALAERARTLLRGVRLSLHAWPRDEAGRLAEAIARLDPSMVVADLAGEPFEARGRIAPLLARATCPVLFLSGRAASEAAPRGSPAG